MGRRMGKRTMVTTTVMIEQVPEPPALEVGVLRAMLEMIVVFPDEWFSGLMNASSLSVC